MVDDNGALREKVYELLETEEVPSRVSNQLLFAAYKETHREVLKVKKGVRELQAAKEESDKNPSLIKLFRDNPGKTAGSVLLIYAMLQTLWTVGLIRIVASWLGVELPPIEMPAP